MLGTEIVKEFLWSNIMVRASGLTGLKLALRAKVTGWGQKPSVNSQRIYR